MKKPSLPGFTRRAATAIGGAALVLFLESPCPAQEQAFLDSVMQVQQSFHWDHADAGVAQVATTARVRLADQPTNLTTLNFNLSNPDLYSVREINGASYNCVLLTTFTTKNAFWQTAVAQQDLRLHSGSGAGYDIFPWVTAGNDLKTYVAENYAASLTAITVDRRLSQTLGMADCTGQDRVLAFFWVPMESVLRPAYAAAIETQISYDTLPIYPDTSYSVTDGSAGGPAFYFQDYSYSTYSGDGGFEAFTKNNQAKTLMPWTAMGYTYNWNSLEDGQAGRTNDPFRVSSAVGVSEFVVSAGAWVEFDRFVENDDLHAYLVPEPGCVTLLAFAAGFILLRKRRRGLD